MEALYYEDFEVGAEQDTPGRVVTQADIEAFADVSGDRNPLHLDEAYAAESVFGGLVAHGILGLAVVTGLMNRSRLTAGTLVAFLGLDWSFKRPIRPGDEVSVRMRVAEKRETRSADRGLVKLALELRNQADKVVQSGTFSLLVKRKE